MEPVVSGSRRFWDPSSAGLPVARPLILVDPLDSEFGGVVDEPGEDVAFYDLDAGTVMSSRAEAVAGVERRAERVTAPGGSASDWSDVVDPEILEVPSRSEFAGEEEEVRRRLVVRRAWSSTSVPGDETGGLSQLWSFGPMIGDDGVPDLAWTPLPMP